MAAHILVEVVIAVLSLTAVLLNLMTNGAVDVTPLILFAMLFLGAGGGAVFGIVARQQARNRQLDI